MQPSGYATFLWENICMQNDKTSAGGLGRGSISESPHLPGHMDSVLRDLPWQKKDFKQGESLNHWPTG